MDIEKEKNIKINESIQEYYQLKSTYENNYYEQYIKPIIKLKDLNYREKKLRFKKLPKPKCINCKRNVSTIFSIKGNEKSLNHTYNAMCGDISDPCPLNIKIQMTNVKLIGNILLENESPYGSINLSKVNIIKAKNDLLFGYLANEEAFKIFDDLANELEAETKLYEFLIEKFIMNYANPNEKLNIIEEKVGLGLIIQEFKSIIKEFNKTNNQNLINNAVEIYINEIEPKLKKITTMSFAINKMEYNENEDIYELIQKQFSIEQLEVQFDISKIDSFVIGTLNKVNKTLKKNITKKGTRKNKITLIEEPEPDKETEKKKDLVIDPEQKEELEK
jgi:hypothetical protein